MAHRHKNKGRARHRTHENKPPGIAQTGRRVQGVQGTKADVNEQAASAPATTAAAATVAAPVA